MVRLRSSCTQKESPSTPLPAPARKYFDLLWVGRATHHSRPRPPLSRYLSPEPEPLHCCTATDSKRVCLACPTLHWCFTSAGNPERTSLETQGLVASKGEAEPTHPYRDSKPRGCESLLTAPHQRSISQSPDPPATSVASKKSDGDPALPWPRCRPWRDTADIPPLPVVRQPHEPVPPRHAPPAPSPGSTLVVPQPPLESDLTSSEAAADRAARWNLLLEGGGVPRRAASGRDAPGAKAAAWAMTAAKMARERSIFDGMKLSRH